MQMYGVTGDTGKFETYTYTEDSATGTGSWAYDNAGSINMDQIMELSKSFDASTFSEYGVNFALAPAAVDVNGTECYELTTVLDSATIETMITRISEQADQDLMADENVSTALSYMNGLKLNISYYIDAATWLPVSMHMDMNDSDVSTLNTLLGLAMGDSAEGTTVTLALNDVSVDATTTYGDVAEITVPAEALAAVAAGEAESVDEMVAGLESTVETEAVTEAAAQ